MSQHALPELQYQIALTLAPAIGPISARKLLQELGSAKAVFHRTRSSLEQIPGIGPHMSESLQNPTLLVKAARELEFIRKKRISPILLKDPGYPRRLKECEDAPILIYVSGSKALEARRVLSVVGTRRASSYGKERCRSIVLELSKRIEDLVIVSGLAFGIDVIAHRAALEAGIPTLAVLGHGLHTCYPHAHRETAKKITTQGALITDFPSGMGPERNNFLRRNRIIAGMADATLVVESAASGGALITAAMASSYQRDVLAVPGRTTDDRSRGCNRLIKDNVAALVESAEDVIRHLNWEEDASLIQEQKAQRISFTEQERQLLKLMIIHNGLRPEELCIRSGIPIQKILSLLTEMELKQWVQMEPGNFYQCMIVPY